MQAVQASFEDLGAPLAEVAFCFVDLETTGGSPRDSRITEVGAIPPRESLTSGQLRRLLRSQPFDRLAGADFMGRAGIELATVMRGGGCRAIREHVANAWATRHGHSLKLSCTTLRGELLHLGVDREPGEVLVDVRTGRVAGGVAGDVDAHHPAIANDNQYNFLADPSNKKRVLRGKTSAGKKVRGLRWKGKGAELLVGPYVVLDKLGDPDPHAVAYVGDRVDNDVRPARAAGLRAVWIRRGPWGVLQDDGGAAHLTVASLDEFVARAGDAFRA